MTLPDHQVHGWIASLVDRTADQLRAELALLVQQVQGAARTHEVASATAPISGPISPLSPEFPPQGLHSAVSAPRHSERQASLALAAEMLEAMTALDEAASLSDILNVLVDRAAVHAGRVLLVVERGDALTGWRWQGYTADPRDATTVEIGSGDQGLILRAARSGVTETGREPVAGYTGDASGPESRAAIAVPLRVEGQVVAVLYADVDDDQDARANATNASGFVRRPWPEVVGVLARHAARCLESMTARRLPELVRMPVTAGALLAVEEN